MNTLASSCRPWALLALAAVAASASQGAAQEVQVPARTGPFEMTDSSRYEQAELGIMYRYFDAAEQVPANAYVYPVPEDRLGRAETLQVSAEAKSFIASLQEGIARGWYREAEVVVDRPLTFQTKDGPRPGHLVVAVFRRDEGNLVSLMHLVLLGGQYVKTRLTLPVEQWRNSLAPNFGPELFEKLAVPDG